MHRRTLTAIGIGTVLLTVGLGAVILVSGAIDPVLVLVLAVWALGGLGWIAAGEDWAVADLTWYQLVGVGVGLVAVGMGVLAAQTLATGGDQVIAGMQGMIAVVLAIQAINHYRGGNITDIVDV